MVPASVSAQRGDRGYEPRYEREDRDARPDERPSRRDARYGDMRHGNDGRGRVRTFDAPRLGGLPLDICPSEVGIEGLLRGRCGMPVATRFCIARGFDEALDAPHVRGVGPTRFLNGGVVEHEWATSFRYITCG